MSDIEARFAAMEASIKEEIGVIKGDIRCLKGEFQSRASEICSLKGQNESLAGEICCL